MATAKPERLASLVLDFTIYPRSAVDAHHVARLAEALRAGVELPPPVADRKSRRVVDGFHRIKARLQVDGVEATAPVEWRTYQDEVALFVDAAACNSHHGLRLSRLDEAHCIEVAQRLGVPDDQVATVLAITRQKFEDMRSRRFATGPDGEPVLLKTANRHLAGQRLNAKQVQGNSRASGMSLIFHIDQIINALKSGTADGTDLSVLARLRDLVVLAQSIIGETEHVSA
jgi:hypothetical protein